MYVKSDGHQYRYTSILTPISARGTGASIGTSTEGAGVTTQYQDVTSAGAARAGEQSRPDRRAAPDPAAHRRRAWWRRPWMLLLALVCGAFLSMTLPRYA